MDRDAPRKDARPRGLTPFGRSLVTGGGALLFVGLAFGSFPYLLGALLLLGVAFAGRGLAPATMGVTRKLSAEDVRTGEPLDVGVDAQNKGAAPVGVTIEDRAPDAFTIDTGSNFEAAHLAPGAPAILAYRLRAPKRGAHAIGRLRVTTYDPLFVQTALVDEVGETTDVAVHPRTPPAPRIRGGTAWGRTQLPGGDKAVRGILTNDFRELRPYERGDPLKQVNWKATARQSYGDTLNLVVNDYEVEGKKVVWIFLDASPYTAAGTTLESKFDDIATAALSVAAHYIDMGHRVGFTIYGSHEARILYPEAGDMQERRIAAAIGTTSPGEPGEGMREAVEAAKGFLAREKPLIYVFTLVGRDPALHDALVTARAIASTGRRPAPVIVVAPQTDDDPTDAASMIMRIHERAHLRGLERRGVTLIRYHPERAPLHALLARGVIR